MFDYVDFSEFQGKKKGKDLLLFTLSTCAFCAEALAFLRNNGLQFRWAVTDELPFTVRRRLRNEFIRTFRERIYYPALVIDEEKVLTGFEIEEWREELRNET